MKKPRMATLIALLAVVLAGMFAIKKCSHPANPEPLFAPADSYPAKASGDTLDVAIEISPLSYNISSDSISGLDYEILQSLAQNYGLKFKYHVFAPLNWAVKGLEDGHFDLLVSSLQSTTKIKTRLPVTTSIYIDRQVLVQAKNSKQKISSAEELGGDTIWIAKGSPVAQRLANLSGEIGDTIYVDDSRALTSEHLIMLTAAGKIPRCVVPEGLAKAMAADNSTLDADIPVSFNQFQVWAVSPRNPELLKKLNALLEQFSQTPQYQAIHQKYLSR